MTAAKFAGGSVTVNETALRFDHTGEWRGVMEAEDVAVLAQIPQTFTVEHVGEVAESAPAAEVVAAAPEVPVEAPVGEADAETASTPPDVAPVAYKAPTRAHKAPAVPGRKPGRPPKSPTIMTAG